MSDAQEKRPETPVDPKEASAVPPQSDGGAAAQTGGKAIDEQARLSALNELDSARKQLLAAQEQMDRAQERLRAIEQGLQPPDGQHAKNAAIAPQKFAGLPAEPAAEPAQQAGGAKAVQAEAPVRHYGVMNGFFDFFASLGPISIFIFMACMAWPIFLPGSNLTYCPAELKSISAFMGMVATGSWLTPVALDNGAWSLAQWPAFSWCLALASLIPGLGGSYLLLPIVSFCCAFAAAFGVWILTIGTGFGAKAAMAAVIILLCAPLFAPMPHFIGPGALTAALTLFALFFFYRGWKAHSSWICLPLAYIFTALAGLSGGWLPFITPLATSVCFLIWRGSLGHLRRFDSIFGILLMLIILGAWFGALMMGQGNEAYLDNLFANSWQWALPVPIKWFLAIAVGILGLVPWILIIFGVSWARVLAKSAKSFSASRHDNGSAMLWISIVIAGCLSIFVPWFHPSAILIGCLLAALLGKAFMRMPHFGNCLFFLLALLCAILAGLIILGLHYPTAQEYIFKYLPQLPIANAEANLASLDALPIISGILIVGGLIALFFVKHCRGAGGLFYAMLLTILLCQPARLMLAPQLAAMPDSPLINYKVIEDNVIKALATPPAAPEAAPAPMPAEPAAAPEAPAAPEAGQPSQDQAPAAPADEAAQTNGASSQPEDNGQASGAPAPEASGDQPKVDEVIIIEEPNTGESGGAAAPAQ